jgi:hypothetical protein
MYGIRYCDMNMYENIRNLVVLILSYICLTRLGVRQAEQLIMEFDETIKVYWYIM